MWHHKHLKNMHLRKFRKTYGLDLLPVSHSEISLGDLIWRPKYGRPKLVKKGLPSHIYNIFLHLKMISQLEWRNAMLFFESEETHPAKLGDYRISADRLFANSFPHHILNLFKNDLSVEKNIAFSFSNLQVKIITNEWRLKIQKLIEKIPLPEQRKIFKRSRPVHIITELYYGNITIMADRKVSLEIEASLKRHFEKPLHKYDEDNSRVYEFAHNQVPFAMRIEAIDGFKA